MGNITEADLQRSHRLTAQITRWQVMILVQPLQGDKAILRKTYTHSSWSMMMAPSDSDVTVLATEVSDRTYRSRTELTVVRWVNAIWTVLERTRGARSRTPSLRSLSRPASMVSTGDGSSSTHYRPGQTTTPSPLSPTASATTFGPIPLMTTDDAVITTSAGFAAPIVQRGSRHLAAGGLERSRSLRRVASEADLSESAGATEEYRSSPPDLSSTPLTVDAARTARASRDFMFALSLIHI